MKTYKNPSGESVSRQAIEAINLLLAKHKKYPILFHYSGGSSLQLLNGIEAQNINYNITFVPLDERFSRDKTINNYSIMTGMPFYTTALAQECRFINTYPTASDTLEDFASRYALEITNWRKQNPLGITLVLFGIGEDGHVCGIMPYPENKEYFHETFNNNEVMVVGYDAGDKSSYPLRVTPTLPYFRKYLKAGIAYAAGKNKQEAISRVLTPEGKLEHTPARLLREFQDVELFTDVA
ncbi:MAG: 6-phosphogluconolactonase [Candidatus Dojkabacteria bacterium]